MTKEKKQEFILRITRANKSGMIVILYDMVLEYLQDALELFEKEDKQAYRKSIGNAKGCIDELINSLNYQYEVAGALRSLYYFYKREITTAAVLEKTELIPPVMEMLRELRESSEKIALKDTSAPIMKNTQDVYAGLTYGKNSLNIDLTNQGGDRGFRI